MKQGKKICVLGTGNVGATIAYTIALSGMAAEIVLIDIAKDKAEGEAMDISQGNSHITPVNIYSGDYPDAKGSEYCNYHSWYSPQAWYDTHRLGSD